MILRKFHHLGWHHLMETSWSTCEWQYSWNYYLSKTLVDVEPFSMQSINNWRFSVVYRYFSVNRFLIAVYNLFRVLTQIDFQQSYPINSSTGKCSLWSVLKVTVYYVLVTACVPMIRVIEGQAAVISFPVLDWDMSNDIRCRWSSSAGTVGDECDDVCKNFSSAVLWTKWVYYFLDLYRHISHSLLNSNCTITWPAVRRSLDISAGINSSTYIAAIMVEDFPNPASIRPRSSVPLQV